VACRQMKRVFKWHQNSYNLNKSIKAPPKRSFED
jgi:hypothetical protein